VYVCSILSYIKSGVFENICDTRVPYKEQVLGEATRFRLTLISFIMNNENVCVNESDSEDEGKLMHALPDFDVDDIVNQLLDANLDYESEEYR
jgi:hypothetical protein